MDHPVHPNGGQDFFQIGGQIHLNNDNDHDDTGVGGEVMSLSNDSSHIITTITSPTPSYTELFAGASQRRRTPGDLALHPLAYDGQQDYGLVSPRNSSEHDMVINEQPEMSPSLISDMPDSVVRDFTDEQWHEMNWGYSPISDPSDDDSVIDPTSLQRSEMTPTHDLTPDLSDSMVCDPTDDPITDCGPTIERQYEMSAADSLTLSPPDIDNVTDSDDWLMSNISDEECQINDNRSVFENDNAPSTENDHSDDIIETGETEPPPNEVIITSTICPGQYIFAHPSSPGHSQRAYARLHMDNSFTNNQIFAAWSENLHLPDRLVCSVVGRPCPVTVNVGEQIPNNHTTPAAAAAVQPIPAIPDIHWETIEDGQTLENDTWARSVVDGDGVVRGQYFPRNNGPDDQPPPPVL